MSGYLYQFRAICAPSSRVDGPNIAAHNRAIEALELDAWTACPYRAIGYVKHELGFDPRRPTVYGAVTITTWIGTPLAYGAVTGAYRNNFNSRIVCVRVRGTNGRTYIGRYGYDGGELIRLRRASRVR